VMPKKQEGKVNQHTTRSPDIIRFPIEVDFFPRPVRVGDEVPSSSDKGVRSNQKSKFTTRNPELIRFPIEVDFFPRPVRGERVGSSSQDEKSGSKN